MSLPTSVFLNLLLKHSPTFPVSLGLNLAMELAKASTQDEEHSLDKQKQEMQKAYDALVEENNHLKQVNESLKHSIELMVKTRQLKESSNEPLS